MTLAESSSPHTGAKPKCGARTRGGAPCDYVAGYKTSHVGIGRCNLHGGASPNAILSAERIKAAELVAALGLPVDVDPTTAIRQAIARANGAVLYIANVVQQLEQDDFVWGVTRRVSRVKRRAGCEDDEVYVTERQEARINLWVQLLLTWDKHLTDMCIEALKLGLREREDEFAKRHGEQMYQLMQDIFGDPELGLDAEAQETARRVACRHLSLVVERGGPDYASTP